MELSWGGKNRMLSRKNIVFQAQNEGVINYDNNYIVSVILYNKMTLADKEYAEWLHNVGYRAHNNKKFQLFNFSLILNGLDMLSNGIKINKGDIIKLAVSGNNEPLNAVLKGFSLESNVTLNNVHFTLMNVEDDKIKLHKTNIYKVLSPLVESIWDKKIMYLSPYQSKYVEAIKKNLLRKYELIYKKEYKGELKIGIEDMISIKPKTIRIKQGYLQGYAKFNLIIQADINMQKIVYYLGLGQNNSMGCGFLQHIVGGE